MRTTLTIEDGAMRELRRFAAKEGLSLKEAVNRALRAGLAAMERPVRRRARRSPVFAMGTPTCALDKALQIAGEMENEEIVRKVALRK